MRVDAMGWKVRRLTVELSGGPRRWSRTRSMMVRSDGTLRIENGRRQPDADRLGARAHSGRPGLSIWTIAARDQRCLWQCGSALPFACSFTLMLPRVALE
jgi:hypothetical protein